MIRAGVTSLIVDFDLRMLELIWFRIRSSEIFSCGGTIVAAMFVEDSNLNCSNYWIESRLTGSWNRFRQPVHLEFPATISKAVSVQR